MAENKDIKNNDIEDSEMLDSEAIEKLFDAVLNDRYQISSETEGSKPKSVVDEEYLHEIELEQEKWSEIQENLEHINDPIKKGEKGNSNSKFFVDDYDDDYEDEIIETEYDSISSMFERIDFSPIQDNDKISEKELREVIDKLSYSSQDANGQNNSNYEDALFKSYFDEDDMDDEIDDKMNKVIQAEEEDDDELDESFVKKLHNDDENDMDEIMDSDSLNEVDMILGLATSDDDLDDDDIDSEQENQIKEKISFIEKIKRLIKKFFANVYDKKYEEKVNLQIKEDEEKNRLRQKKTAEMKAKNEELKAQKVEEDKLHKIEKAKQKAAERIKKREAKEAVKKKRLEEEAKEPKTRINRVGATIVVCFFTVLTTMLIVLAVTFDTKGSMDEAIECYKNDDYEEAYRILTTIDESEQDEEFYNKTKLLQKLNKQLSYCNSYIIIEKYPEALNSLIVAVKNYQDEYDEVKELGIEDKYDTIYKDVLKQLEEKFSIDETKAKELADISSSYDYSKRINEICNEIYE